MGNAIWLVSQSGKNWEAAGSSINAAGRLEICRCLG
jgi:hypothetical protein